ncbi:MAG: YHS domain-containing (seleno)protein [Pseudomonadota bacterium]
MEKPNSINLGRGSHLVRRLANGLGVATVLGLLAGVAALASTNRQVVVDPITGRALFGFDPVAYFVDRTARTGSETFAGTWAGATWHFVNVGNMKAFLDAPQAYAPQFGGYGALSVARGLTTAGRPVIFEIHEDRLYLFYSETNRHIWLKSPDEFIAAANDRWPDVKRRLTR